MKLLRTLLLLLGLLLVGHLRGMSQVFEWAQLAHNLGNNGSVGLGATTDPAGHTYAVFSFVDSARVGRRIVRHPGNVRSGYQIVRYDSTGAVVWIRPLRGVQVPLGTSNGLKADPVNGGFFITGSLSANATWGGVPITGAASIPAGSSAGFYGKCDRNGNLLWIRPLPTSNINFSANLTVDQLGNCYLAGATSSPNQGVGNTTIGGMAIDSTEMFLVGNNAAGSGEWVRRLRGTPLPRALTRPGYRSPSGIGSLKVGPRADGGCLLFGTFNQDLYFGSPGNPPVLPSRQPLNTFDDFIATVSPAGTLTWIRPGQLGGTPNGPVPSVNAAAADQAGNYYVAGRSTKGISVAKYSTTGSLLWATNQSALSTPDSLGGATMLVVDANNEVTVVAVPNSSLSSQVVTIGNFELRKYEESLIHFNVAGVPQWVTGSRNAGDPNPQRTSSYNEAVALGLDVRGNVYFVTAPGSFSPNPAAGNNGFTPPTFLLGDFTQVGAGISVARIGTKHNTIRGQIYLDANGNGVRDANEGAFPHNVVLQAVQPTTTRLGTFDTQGFFNVYVGAGSYSLAVPVPPLHYAVTQPTTGPYTGNFVGFGRVDAARHFGFQPIANQADVRVTLTPYGAARPGFVTRYRATVENVGTTTASGTATATLDSRALYVSSTPNGSQTGQTVTWSYANLAPFGRREFDVLFSLPVNIPLGTQLTSTATASLAGDMVPADNSTTAIQTVTGSFDPNDLTVNYQRLTPAQVAAGLPLDYTIRFQNMGTDTAFTVVVTDMLDFRKLNLASLQLVAQSHNCIWSLSGTGLLTVRFLNIKLPYRNQDVIRSQGFVRFRVQPRTTLTIGETIPNSASIVFDYNDPIVTNTVTTAVLLPTAALARHDAPAWEVYPNPATEAITITANLPTGGPVRLELLDVLGRPIRKQTLTVPAGILRQTLDLRSLAAGVYMLRITPATGPASSRQVVRE
ncbi:T9SS type A sorting domain-containing protein [Hymenobacter terrenus]|uniref:T9SS type A sorting domain-containing protein n=1 Tax=Hymenobacter terrenus TaxID=1629124 RepID=UPI0006192A8E|nr:T9SS type A sorting domain-containing protein [Hymenobacter terrenus]